jgi:hypothetical protein
MGKWVWGVFGAAVVMVAAGQPAVAAVATGPVVVAMWHLDEPAGSTTMYDSVGTHNGTITGSVIEGVTPAVSGTAYEFSGSNPIVRVPSSDDLNPYLSPLTISAWLDIPSTLTPGDYNVLQKGPATTIGGAYKLEVVGNKGAKFGYPDCAFNSAGAKDRVYGPQRINDDTWHLVECHLTATQAYVTVDGVSGTPKTRTVGNIANTVDLTLGGKPNNTHYFNGRADEVSITIG